MEYGCNNKFIASREVGFFERKAVQHKKEIFSGSDGSCNDNGNRYDSQAFDSFAQTDNVERGVDINDYIVTFHSNEKNRYQMRLWSVMSLQILILEETASKMCAILQ